MKITALSGYKFGATLAALAVAFASQVRAENIPQVVHVLRVEGTAQWSTDNRNWKAVQVGDELHAGSMIRTAENSLVDVLLGDRDATASMPSYTPTTANPSAGGGGGAGGGGDEEAAGNVIRIFAGTFLGVDKLLVDRSAMDEVSDTQLDLQAGQIFVNVKKLSKQSHYEVKIPNGMAGIRGTAGLISSKGFIQTFYGAIVIGMVENGTVNPVDVPTGHGYDPFTHQVTPLPPGAMNTLSKIFDELRPILHEILEHLLGHDHTIIFCSPVVGTHSEK